VALSLDRIQFGLTIEKQSEAASLHGSSLRSSELIETSSPHMWIIDREAKLNDDLVFFFLKM